MHMSELMQTREEGLQPPLKKKKKKSLLFPLLQPIPHSLYVKTRSMDQDLFSFFLCVFFTEPLLQLPRLSLRQNNISQSCCSC